MSRMKESIYYKLTIDKVNAKGVNIDEILSIYNHITNYSFEESLKYFPEDNIDPRYECFRRPHDKLEEKEKKCYEIFKCLIELKKKSLLHLIDYCFLNYYFKETGYSMEYRIHELYKFLNDILDSYDNCYGDFEEFFRNYWDNVIDETACDYSNSVYNSMLVSIYIPDYYKNYLKLYHEILNRYYYDLSDEEIELSGYMNFMDFIDLSFKYLVFNGLIQNDNPDVVKFLENIKDNIFKVLDEVKLSGATDYGDLYQYIDILYNKTNSKVKEIK